MAETKPVDWAGMTFEELVTALERLTERMASGQIGIEEATELYEQAEQLHARAAERLASVQARIEALAGKETKPKGETEPNGEDR